MKQLRILVLFLLTLCLGFPSTFAQNVSTQGKEFWVSFLGNGFKTRYDTWSGAPQFTWLRIQLIISSKRNCNCTVKNPNTGYEQTFQVHANNPYLLDDIPWEQAYMELEEHGQILSKGLYVTADDTISVYCSNIAEVSFDASYILPVPALGDDYIIQTYDQTTNGGAYSSFYTSAFLIVATENGTTVDITPSVNTLDGHNSGIEYSITLQRGETYQVRSTTGNDLSGTRVSARDCKKIAVFNGNNLTMVPDDGNDSDCIFEQAMPLSAWGRKFVVTASLGRQFNDIVKITSAYDNNEIHKNGEVFTTLDAGESITFALPISDKSCFIEAAASCAVYLYNHSADGFFGSVGDGAPSMVWIAPIEQRINEITFSTFNYESEHDTHIDKHYVNIIVSTNDIQSVYLDGEALSPLLFETVNGTSDYRFIRIEVEHDSHHLTCANGFNAHVYGFGHAKGYAYLVGSNAKDLSTNLTINDVQVQAEGVFPYCVDQAVTFNADVNFQGYDLLWDFGDGTTSTENPTTHIYHDKRVYEASLFVDTDAGGCYTANSDTMVFYIDLTQKYVTEHDETCEGELYSGHGFTNVMINNDTILARLQDNPINPECQDSLLLYITAKPQYHFPITDSRCWQGASGVYDDHGFSFIYDSPGVYERTQELQTIQGCDSIVTLTLTVSEQVTYDFDHHECSESYTWDGRTYDHEGVYSWTYLTPGGCDSVATLHLTMGTDKYYEFDTIMCGTFTWDGIEYETSGDYTRHYSSYDNCDSVVVCHLSVSGNVEGPTTYASECDSYTWLDETYTKSGIYSFAYPTPLGCDSTVYLNLSLDFTPNPFPIDNNNIYPHWVVTATEFQINSYEFSFRDHNEECHWDSVSWVIDTPGVNWLLETDSTTMPPNLICKMYVLNYVPDTIWLRATAYNHCYPQGVSQRYWFVCSFYGNDEHTVRPEIDIMPNPSNGEMSIQFGDVEGIVDITVYDMHGQTIDRFSLTANPMSRHSYNLSEQKNGIYLFVFNYNGFVVTKKIVITN